MDKLSMFVRAVLRPWLALAAGAASLGLSIWEHAAEKAVKLDVFSVVGAALLVFAFYRAWAEEYDKRIAAEQRPPQSAGLATVQVAIEALAEQNKAKDAQIAQVGAQLSTLQARRLSPDQQDKIVESLAGTAGTIVIINDVSAHDAKVLAEDFREVFQRAGWTVSLGPTLQVRVPPPSGIAMEALPADAAKRMSRKDPSETRALIKSAMDTAGVSTDSREFCGGWNDADACIVVGHRPSLVDEAVARSIGASWFGY